MKEEKLETYRQTLLKLRTEILSQFEKEKVQSSADVLSESGDEMDLASEQREREFYHIMGERDKNKLNQIQAALDRLDSGEFGICEECGEEIGEKRLTAVPFSTLCVDCKEKQEIEIKNARAKGEDSAGMDLGEE